MLEVTNDSGPAHIAYALQTPTVTIFGDPRSPRTNGPLNDGPFRLLVSQRKRADIDGRNLCPSPQTAPILSASHVFAAVTEIIRLRP